MSVSPFTVYTILHPDKLAQLAASGRTKRLREAKRWVTAKKLFDQAHARGQSVPVVYGDAAYDCSKLIYWGELTEIEVDAEGTTYSVKGLSPLEGHRTQELVLLSTKQNIAEGYLRPYALVSTPSFLPLAAPNRPVTLFTFGYWGNGSATGTLVEAIDAAERQRGFEPPLWVDIRINRSVRAAGFRDDTFAKMLGSRYVWMRDLGNVHVAEGTTGIKIKNPAAAHDLLNHAIVNPGRRVIFFCACEHPSGCHRQVVGQLVAKAAASRDVDASIVEWPGGEPRAVRIEVLPTTFRQLARGAKRTMPIPASMSVGEAAGLPWGSPVDLRSGTEKAALVVGPARFDAHGAHLPVLHADVGTSAKDLEKAGLRFRRERGYEPIV